MSEISPERRRKIEAHARELAATLRLRDPGNNVNFVELTQTDRDFDAANEGYYVFDGDLREDKCRKCGRKFSTHLSCLRFDTRKCQLAFMYDLTTTRQPPRHFSGSERGKG